MAEKKSVLQYEITKKKVKPRDLMHFSRQLGVFIRAGIPIINALEVISLEMTDKVFKPALEDIMDMLRSGSTFSAAASRHEEVFPAFYLGILRSAEVTGNLDVALDELADYIDRDIDVRQKVKSALVYPVIVLGMASRRGARPDAVRPSRGSRPSSRASTPSSRCRPACCCRSPTSWVSGDG